LSDRAGLRQRALVDQDGRVVCPRCEVAATLGSRVRGLLGRSGLAEGEGLLLLRTSSVHTFFMAFPIDVVFLDRKLRVRAVVPGVAPFRMSMRLGFGSVLELASGEASRVGIRAESQLAFYDAIDDSERP
jgi:uncharacterized membrane protein (UPF0127 family)